MKERTIKLEKRHDLGGGRFVLVGIEWHVRDGGGDVDFGVVDSSPDATEAEQQEAVLGARNDWIAAAKDSRFRVTKEKWAGAFGAKEGGKA